MLDQGKTVSAADMIRQHYPFTPIKKNGRKYTPRQMTKVFLRDGFIDRYRGTKLVHPPALRLLSHYLPECFPYHKNAKMNEAHIAYWELFPTIDHLVPVARGGIDSEENWVCCSMLTNSIKSNWLLEELQWDLKIPGNSNVWDGMLSWFLRHVDDHKELLAIGYIKTWFHAGMEISPNRAARGF
ncbi:MAG: HNH endonuclease [Desulfuromonas sp.]